MICVCPAQCFHHQRMHTGIIIRGKTSHCFFLFLRIVLIVMQSNRIISRYTSCAANNLIRARPMQEVRYRHKCKQRRILPDIHLRHHIGKVKFQIESQHIDTQPYQRQSRYQQSCPTDSRFPLRLLLSLLMNTLHHPIRKNWKTVVPFASVPMLVSSILPVFSFIFFPLPYPLFYLLFINTQIFFRRYDEAVLSHY